MTMAFEQLRALYKIMHSHHNKHLTRAGFEPSTPEFGATVNEAGQQTK